MIILVCPLCKSCEVEFGPYTGSYRCICCNHLWEMYEIKQMDSKNYGKPLNMESSAVLQPTGASVGF